MFEFNELMSLARLGQTDNQAQSDTIPVPGATRLTTPDGVTGWSFSFGAIASGLNGSLIMSRKEGETK